MWKCPKCNSENQGNFCSLCGVKMPDSSNSQNFSNEGNIQNQNNVKKPKKGFTILLCVVLVIIIGAVGSLAAFKFLGDSDDSSYIEDNHNNDDDETTDEDEKETFMENVSYEIKTLDHSYKNENGEDLIEHYYDLVVVDEENENIELINRDLEDAMDEFVMDKDELEEYLMDFATPDSPFMNNWESKVTYNADGIFSVKSTRTWFMGGVCNADHFGKTYDINTGLPVTLAELTDMEVDSFEQKIKDQTWEYLDSEYGEGLFTNAYDTLYEKSLDEFNFCIEDGKIILLFSTYEFAPGAAGSITYETGISIVRNNDN